jgi:hypothetical protein
MMTLGQTVKVRIPGSIATNGWVQVATETFPGPLVGECNMLVRAWAHSFSSLHSLGSLRRIPASKGLEQAIQTDKAFKARVEDFTVRYEPEQTGRVFERRFRAKDKDF